jgi:hypothetical protein
MLSDAYTPSEAIEKFIRTSRYDWPFALVIEPVA